MTDSGKMKPYRRRHYGPYFRSSCTMVTKVPDQYRQRYSMRIPNYYQKYLHAYGIPILGGRAMSFLTLASLTSYYFFFFAFSH